MKGYTVDVNVKFGMLVIALITMETAQCDHVLR